MLVCGNGPGNYSTTMKISEHAQTILIKVIVAVYATGIVVMIILAATNYPVQWRVQVNKERMRYLEVYAQAIEYNYLDHDKVMPDIPNEPVMISNTTECQPIFCPALNRNLSCFDAQSLLIPSYMKELLQDPLQTSDRYSGFYFYRSGDRSYALGSCESFFGQQISIEKSL